MTGQPMPGPNLGHFRPRQLVRPPDLPQHRLKIHYCSLLRYKDLTNRNGAKMQRASNGINIYFVEIRKISEYLNSKNYFELFSTAFFVLVFTVPIFRFLIRETFAQ